MNQFKDRKAFSLAEVLITLGIIGVVAAMGIPTLMNHIQDAQYKTAYKKAYSAASQAFLSAKGQGLLQYTSGEGDPNHLQNFLAFMDQFTVTKKCVTNNNAECWDSTGEKWGAYPDILSKAFIDSSGMSWSMYYNGLFILFVDTNGFKKPNKIGKDRFVFGVGSKEYPIYGQVGDPVHIKPSSDQFGNGSTNGVDWLVN